MNFLEWTAKIVNGIKRNKPLAGRGIIVEETPLGTRIHSKAQSVEGGGTCCYKIIIGSYRSSMSYCDYYDAIRYKMDDDPSEAEGTECIASTIVVIGDKIPSGATLTGFDTGSSLTVSSEEVPIYLVYIPIWTLAETEEEE